MTKGQRIKHRREELNILQSDLARTVGISKQTLYKYERDIITNIPSDILEKIAKALDCTPAYLMGWFDNMSTFEIEWRKHGGGKHALILTDEEESFILEARTIEAIDKDFIKRMRAYIKAIKEMENHDKV